MAISPSGRHPARNRAADLRRFGVVALVLLQGSVLAAAPAADAVLEAGWSHETAHVEAEGSDDCGSGHNHLLCQLTRTASSPFSLVPIDLPQTVETDPATWTATAWQRSPIPFGGGGPRAPPPA